jgi:methylated-DNA-[protein]-cysteine S-methyltransferase
MRNNYDPTVPCHRVIRSDGKMGGYNRGGIQTKEKMLAEEAKFATQKK